MSHITLQKINALRETAKRLSKGAAYQWTHQGNCNCGHLAQTITNRSAADIHSAALEKVGDWAQHAREYSEFPAEYCAQTGYPLDHIIQSMLDAGFNSTELAHLERLSDPDVLANLPGGKRELKYRYRDDVVLYMNTWASGLETKAD